MDMIAIENLQTPELLKMWQETLALLGKKEDTDPSWEWASIQLELEKLHALAQELRRKKALEKAKWQP